MSVRNTPREKRRRQFQRALKVPLPGYIDLIQWVKLRSRVTTGDAIRLILAGVLHVDSHVIGMQEIGPRKVLQRFVPADYRGRIRIVEPA